MALSDLEQYQLTMGHVITHPELEHAVQEAWTDHGGSLGEAGEIDVLPYLLRHGFAVPSSSTAHLRPEYPADDSSPTVLAFCLETSSHYYCVGIHLPITFDHHHTP